jgi:hypothetical protein
MAYRYRSEVLDALARHGVRPLEETSPAQILDHLNDLYRYEIRRLRARLLRGEFPKEDYVDHVLTLRRRYMLLSMLVRSGPLEESTDFTDSRRLSVFVHGKDTLILGISGIHRIS